MGNFHIDVIPFGIFGFVYDIISFVFVLIWVFICHGIFPECSGFTLGCASHVPKIIPRI